jgi:hypothetical protein
MVIRDLSESGDFLISDATHHTAVCGSTGSGKTSSLGRQLLKAFLSDTVVSPEDKGGGVVITVMTPTQEYTP